MFEFFTNYGADIVALVVGVGGALTATMATVRAFKTEKRLVRNEQETNEKITVTREGIVNAFKTAKISPELKINISKQVDAVMNKWLTKIVEVVKDNEGLRTDLAWLNAKILANTAAYNKLTEEEKNRINVILLKIDEDDRTIDVSEV